MARMVSSEATKPPTLTTPLALPCRSAGFQVRAKSKPIIEPGPLVPRTTTSTTSSHSGARPGHSSTTLHVLAVRTRIEKTSTERRSGQRPHSRPSSGPMPMPTSTSSDSSDAAVPGESPCPTTRKG